MRIKETIKQILIKKENKAYEKELAGKKFSYDQWARQDEKKKQVPFVEKPQGFVLWKLTGGKLSKEAVSQLSAYFKTHPQVQILYGDEDVEGADGKRSTPWIKPCWSPDTYLTYFYVGSVVAVRESLLKEAGLTIEGDVVEFADTEEIRQQMDALFTRAGAFEKGTKAVDRVPYVLYHAAQKEAWNTHFASRSKLTREKIPVPKVSVIIPSKDNPEILKQCLESLKKQKAEFDIIVVDNGSNATNREIIENMTQGMRYLYRPMEFNFSAMCNLGAEEAREEVLLFLNDDIELCENDWLEEMYKKAVKPYVGAVGLKLYYPHSNLIQHAGVVNMPVGPDHKLRTLPDEQDYYFGWSKYTHNCSAVTGACLMIEAKKYWEIGGFQEKLAVCYNDVDLCFRLYEQGYQNVVINECFAYHHESISRGSDEENPEKQARFWREWTKLYELHPAFVEEDPYYPIELDRWSLNNKIQPAYIYGVYQPQTPSWEVYKEPGNLRYDQCLMARVEMYDKKKMQGYGMVLGDNNACYKKYVILSPDLESDTIAPRSLIMQVENKYRYELERNVPDQINVALGGWCISREGEKLPAGAYKVGMLAVNKVTGLKLFNWCGKVVEI